LGEVLVNLQELFAARFVLDCEHPKNAPLERYGGECIYTHPLYPRAGSRNYGSGGGFVYRLAGGGGGGGGGQELADLEGKIGVVGAVSGEARFLALAVQGLAVVRGNSCLDCCVTVCKKEGRRVVIC
jgi:hypothetical protein